MQTERPTGLAREGPFLPEGAGTPNLRRTSSEGLACFKLRRVWGRSGQRSRLWVFFVSGKYVRFES